MAAWPSWTTTVKRWTKPDANVWHVETLDTDGDGRNEILHSNARGQLLVRNSAGDVLAQYMLGSYVAQFALVRWGDERQPAHILAPTAEFRDGCCKPLFVVLDAKGEMFAKLESPLGDTLNHVAATSVNFGNGAT